MTLQAVCREICDYMDRTWQRLPVSKRLDAPLALDIRILRRDGRDVHDQPSTSITEALEKLLVDLDHPLLVDAGPGGGKSAALRWIARTFAARIGAGEEQLPLPVFVDLGQYAHQGAQLNLRTICDAELNRGRPVNYRTLRDSVVPKLFLLDGLDLLHPAVPAALLDEALNFESDRFVFSTRTNEDLQHGFRGWAKSSCLLLQGLQRDARDEWLQRHIPKTAKLRFNALVKENPFIDSLIRVPLLFVMLVSACIDDGDQAEFDIHTLPGRAGIFAGFIDYAVRRARREGRIDTTTIEQWRDGISPWRAFCFAALTKGYADRIPVDAFDHLLSISEIAGSGSTDRDRHAQWRASLRVATASGLVFEDRGQYQFLHQQFAEHFAGRHLAEQVQANRDQLYPILKPVLERQAFDPIAAHALAVLSSHPATYALVERAISWLRTTDNTGACYLLALSGSSLGCALLHLIATNESLPIPIRNTAVHALGILPHPHATLVLERLIEQTHELQGELADKAIVSLGAIGTEDAQAVLAKITSSPAFTAEQRLQAMTCGALVSTGTARSLARELIAAESTSRDSMLTAVELLKDVGDASDVDSIERLRTRLVGGVWEYMLKRALRGLSKRSQPLEPNAPFQALVNAQLLESVFAMSRRITESPSELVDVTALHGAISANGDGASPELSLLATVLRTAGKEDNGLLLIAQRQLEVQCERHPRLLDTLNAYPHAALLPEHIRVACARASGRRLLILPETTPQKSKQDKTAPAEKLSAEAVAAAFFAYQRETGGPMDSREAAAFSQKIQHPYSHETIRKTKLWQQQFPSQPRGKKQPP